MGEVAAEFLLTGLFNQIWEGEVMPEHLKEKCSGSIIKKSDVQRSGKHKNIKLMSRNKVIEKSRGIWTEVRGEHL